MGDGVGSECNYKRATWVLQRWKCFVNCININILVALLYNSFVKCYCISAKAVITKRYRPAEIYFLIFLEIGSLISRCISVGFSRGPLFLASRWLTSLCIFAWLHLSSSWYGLGPNDLIFTITTFLKVIIFKYSHIQRYWDWH